MISTTGHHSADNYEITTGAHFWDNNLRVVRVNRVAAHANPYADSGETQTWHDTTGGSADSLSGSLRRIGRLARVYGGKNAEDYPAGTNYAEVR